MTNSIFADFIEMAGGDMAVLAARMKEFSDFSDDQHASALNKLMTKRKEVTLTSRETANLSRGS